MGEIISIRAHRRFQGAADRAALVGEEEDVKVSPEQWRLNVTAFLEEIQDGVTVSMDPETGSPRVTLGSRAPERGLSDCLDCRYREDRRFYRAKLFRKPIVGLGSQFCLMSPRQAIDHPGTRKLVYLLGGDSSAERGAFGPEPNHRCAFINPNGTCSEFRIKM